MTAKRKPNTHGGPGRGQGRKPLPPGERLVKTVAMLTQTQAAEMRRRARRNGTTVAAEIRTALAGAGIL